MPQNRNQLIELFIGNITNAIVHRILERAIDKEEIADKYRKELVKNLENIWRELGYSPGKRQLSKYGEKISESPYKKIWGSVKIACEYLARFHAGKITKEELLRGDAKINARETIPLNLRFKILKRDNYTCVKCGQSPAKSNTVELEIDHITPVSKGGTNDIENLQTLCRNCNQGKRNKYKE